MIIGKQTNFDNVKHDMQSSPLGSTHGSDNVVRGTPSSLLDNILVRRREVWKAIIDLGQNAKSHDIGLGMPSLAQGSTRDRTTSGVACHHHHWVQNAVVRH